MLKMRIALIILALTSFLPVAADASEGLGPLMKSQIENTFFEGGRVSPRKVDAFRMNVEKAQNEVQQSLVNYYIHVAQKSPEEAQKKAQSTSLVQAYERLDSIIARLKSSSGQESYQLSTAVLNLGYAVRSEGRRMDYEEIAGYAKGVFKRYHVKRRNPEQNEAFNLWNGLESRFYSQSN